MRAIVGEPDVIPVPDTGPLLFTLTVAHDADPDETAAMVANLEEVAQQAAPGRWRIVVLAHGLTLDVLDDAELAQVGLQRIPER